MNDLLNSVRDDIVSNEYLKTLETFRKLERLWTVPCRIFIDFVGTKAGLVTDIATLEKRVKITFIHLHFIQAQNIKRQE
jgi:hypothetical protein